MTKDIPPYAIVVGNPARIMRMRCEDKWIERIEKLQWWDFPGLQAVCHGVIIIRGNKRKEHVTCKVKGIEQQIIDLSKTHITRYL